MARRWWRKRALRIYHPHMSVHEMVDLDVPAFVAACVQTNAEAIVVNAAGLYAYYPTQVPYHHVPDELGDRDLLGEIVEGLRGQGLRVIAQCDFSRVRKEDAEAHPEWMIQGEEDATHWRTCPASVYQGEAFALPVVRELAQRYGVDGFLFPNLGFQHGKGCPACVQAYGQDDPDGLKWLIWRQERLAAQQRALYEVAKRVNPAVLCFGRHAGVRDASMWDALDGDMVAQGHALTILGLEAELAHGIADTYSTGLTAEVARGARRKRRPLMILSLREGQPGTAYRRPGPSEIKRLAYQAVAHGASLMIETSGAPDRQTDSRTMPAVRDVFAAMRARITMIDDGFRPIQDVGVVWPTCLATQARAAGDQALFAQAQDAAQGICVGLQGAHLPYGVLHDRRITAKGLRRYGVVVVPVVEMLDDARLALVVEYAKEGGRVILGDGAVDAADEDAPVLRLAEMLGWVVRPGLAQADLAILDLSAASPLRDWLGADTMPIGQHRVIAEAGDAIVWMHAAQAIGPDRGLERSHDATSAPEPLMVSQLVGEGVMTYCAWPLGAGYATHERPEGVALIAQAVRFGAQLPPRLQVEAPACIEVTMAHWREGIVIHLVNHAGALMGDVTPVGPVTLDLAWDGPAQVVLAKPGQPDQALPAREQWNRVTITVPRVEVYAQVVVRTG